MVAEDSSAGFSPWLSFPDDGWSCNPFREAKAAATAASTTTKKKVFDLFEEDPFLAGGFPPLLKFPDPPLEMPSVASTTSNDDGWPDPEGWGCSCGAAPPFREAEAGVAAKAAEIEEPTPPRRPRELPRSVVVVTRKLKSPKTPQNKEVVMEPSPNGVASSRSPTSQFEYDNMMIATQQTPDLDNLRKQNIISLLDEDKSISSKESSEKVSNHKKAEEDQCLKIFKDNILSPMDRFTVSTFCRLECAFPELVQDVNEILSNNLHHLIFQGEAEEESEGEADALIQPKKLFDDTDDKQGRGKVGNYPRWGLFNTSFRYNPEAGLVRMDGMLHELFEEEVLIRVDATAISTRDCLERTRRDINEELKDDVWVPGHAIVGHVVHAGMNTKYTSSSGERIAALLPYGGGCSQYVRIDAKDVIPLPEDADEVFSVALLSTYMPAYQCLESVVNLIADDAGQEQKRTPLLGKKVLIFGAGTPDGLALSNLARNAGAIVYTVSHSPLFCEMGADHWYPFYQKKMWKKKWRGKMDLIVDTVGDPDYNPSFFKIMKTRGRLVRLNITSSKKKFEPHTGTRGNQMRRYLKSYKERVINDKAIDYDIFQSFNDDKELFTEDLAYLHDLFQLGKIRPKIVSQVPFDQIESEWKKVMVDGVMIEGMTGVLVVFPWRK